MAKCENCVDREFCEATFGKFFADKSAGGRGCNYPVEMPPWWHNRAQVDELQVATKRARQMDF